MVVMLLALLLATLAIPCILLPDQVWKAFNVGDDGPEYGMHDVNIVALRMYQAVQFAQHITDVCLQETLFARVVHRYAWQS